MTLDEVAKEISSDPEMFKEDLLELHIKFEAFILKYGGAGLEVLLQAISAKEKVNENL